MAEEGKDKRTWYNASTFPASKQRTAGLGGWGKSAVGVPHPLPEKKRKKRETQKLLVFSRICISRQSSFVVLPYFEKRHLYDRKGGKTKTI